MELYNNIASVLSKKGINLVVGNIYDFQQIWLQWYRGSVDDFHYYTAKINGKTTLCERKTMNMPKKICEDISKLLWTEKTRIDLGNPESTERLWNVLDSKENSFTVNFPIFLEKACAIGTGALIEYKDINNKTIIDYLDGTVIIPYLYTNSYIRGLVTISRFTEEIEKNKKVYYTHLTYHEYANGVYTKYNEIYKSENENELGDESDFSNMFPNVLEIEEITTDVPRFQIFKPNIANNYDINSPMGISVLANSIDRFQSIDLKYDSFYNEFVLGKKRILVDPTAMKAQWEANQNGDTTLVQYFDTEDRAFVAINGMEGQPIKDIDMSIRATEHIEAINSELNWLSSNVGLGTNFYKFDGVTTKTATEVMSENSQAFRSKVHHDIIVNDVVYDLVKVICEMENIPITNLSIIADDSIIEDKNTEQIKAQQEVSAGLMSKKTYLMNQKGMSEDEANKELMRISEEKSKESNMFDFQVSEE